MVRVGRHVSEQLQELASGIVSPVLEDDGAPEENVKPLTYRVPDRALPEPMGLDDARDVSDGDAVDTSVAQRRKNVALKSASPSGFSPSTAPTPFPRLDDHLEKLAHCRGTTLAPTMGDRIDALISESQILQGHLTSGNKGRGGVPPKTDIPPATVDHQTLSE